MRAPRTLAILGLCAVLGALPGLAARLEYDRAALLRGELWRVLGAHLVHCSPSHLGWNALGFGILGALCERRDRRRFACALALSAVAIPAGLCVLQPGLASYRGLSGATSALFGLLGVSLIRDQLRAGQRAAALASAGLCLGFMAVLARTWLAGRALLVAGYGADVAPVPLAHAIGLAVGIGVAIHTTKGRSHMRVLRYSGALAALAAALTQASPAAAEGLQRIHSRSGAPVAVRVEGPATVYVRPDGPPPPRTMASDELVWGAPAGRPAGLLPAAAASTSRSYEATSRALDPIVDPLLETTAQAVGTAAGTALGIGLYAPIKVLQHVTGATP